MTSVRVCIRSVPKGSCIEGLVFRTVVFRDRAVEDQSTDEMFRGRDGLEGGKVGVGAGGEHSHRSSGEWVVGWEVSRGNQEGG